MSGNGQKILVMRLEQELPRGYEIVRCLHIADVPERLGSTNMVREWTVVVERSENRLQS